MFVTRDGENMIYKISNFCPQSSLNLPLTSESTQWPFARHRSSKMNKAISENEKLEILMLKDIYSLGICVLELMIGRIGSN